MKHSWNIHKAFMKHSWSIHETFMNAFIKHRPESKTSARKQNISSDLLHFLSRSLQISFISFGISLDLLMYPSFPFEISSRILHFLLESLRKQNIGPKAKHRPARKTSARKQNIGCIHETFIKHSWNIHEAFMKHSWSIHRTFIKHSWSILKAFMKHSSSIHEAFMKHSSSIHEAFMKHS